MDLSIITDLEFERDKLRSELAAAQDRIKGHGYCGMHGLFRCHEEDTPCPSCELAYAKEHISELERLLQQLQTTGNISETHREDR